MLPAATIKPGAIRLACPLCDRVFSHRAGYVVLNEQQTHVLSCSLVFCLLVVISHFKTHGVRFNRKSPESMHVSKRMVLDLIENLHNQCTYQNAWCQM